MEPLLSGHHHHHGGGGGGFRLFEALGEAIGFTARLLTHSDGSWLAVQTDKPLYYAGETITGKVIAYITNPRRCDGLTIKLKCTERTYWDDEHCETIWEGEGENRKAREIWHHHERQGKDTLYKAVGLVSPVTQLNPGTWAFPFAMAIPAALPGAVSFRKTEPPRDPHWRHHDRALNMAASITYSLKAQLRVGGFFSKDLHGRSEVAVNPFFDWSKMTPASVARSGTVCLCCCIPRGEVHLSAAFDKAAYAAGECVQVRTVINNESKSEVRRMVSQLHRNIVLQDGRGHTKVLAQTMARAEYPGVPSHAVAERDMPLLLASGPSAGPFFASASGRLLRINYHLDVVCDVSFCPDIEARAPVTIYNPPPTVWGLAACFGGAGIPAFVTPDMLAPVVAPGAGAGAMPIPVTTLLEVKGTFAR